jgi:predicted lipoprotein with Yx(FWY)xxD motif
VSQSLGSAGRPPRRARPGGLAMALIAVTAAAVGCGGHAASAVPQSELQARALPGLGKIVTDGKGFTLYMYAPDHRGPSRCYGFCAQQWPPLVLPRGVTRPEVGPGIDKRLVGTVRRSNGALQETYGGWPLYLWQGDTAPGQATGQADDMGLWYVLSVTGTVDRGTPLS